MALLLACGLPCAARAQTASVTTIHSFVGPTNGVSPRASLVLGRDGNFYGTTQGGGPAEQGTVFVVTPAGRLTTLYSFGAVIGPANTNGVNADGAMPTAGLVQAADGNFYGTTLAGGAYGYGTVFSVTPGGTLTVVHSFSGSEGASQSTLLPTADGGFYGVAQLGGAYGNGTVFALSPAGNLTTLHDFTNDEGRSPQGALVSDAAGNLYGTLSDGGPWISGAVFTITPTGVFTVLHTFTSNNGGGSKPVAGLVRGRDGNFYGTTTQGGDTGQGTIYKMTPDGTVTILHSFDPSQDGANPNSPLFLAADGAFYGTTNSTAFKVTADGRFTLLAHLNGNNGGPDQVGSGLVAGTDGNFYGALSYSYASDGGLVYTLTPAGVLTVLHAFDQRGNEGDSPRGLPQGSDGNFYGTTSEGGQSARGMAFVVTPAGALTVLHSFGGSAAEGTYPGTALVPGSDGNFHGTTNLGGSDGNGTAFVMTPGGVTTTIYHFSGPDGARPNSNLVRASDGSFYGASYAGGLYNLGAVYRLTPGGTTPATTPAPDAQMGGAHPDAVTQSDNGDAFTLIVANVGTANTGGTVTVTVTPGSGLSLADASGPGWTCTRADALGVGHNYPALTALVNVSPDAPATGTLTSHVTAAGDGHVANDTLADRFPINAAASTPTQRWRHRYFGTTANSGSAADTANPAGDGIPNLMKYALGLDPMAPGANPVTVDTTTSYLRLTAPKNPDATDLSYAVQVSAGPLSDGQGWTTDGTVPMQNTATLLQARDATRVGAAGRRFIRLKVSR